MRFNFFIYYFDIKPNGIWSDHCFGPISKFNLSCALLWVLPFKYCAFEGQDLVTAISANFTYGDDFHKLKAFLTILEMFYSYSTCEFELTQ